LKRYKKEALVQQFFGHHHSNQEDKMYKLITLATAFAALASAASQGPKGTGDFNLQVIVTDGVETFSGMWCK